MRLVIQRVTSARVETGGRITGQIGSGLLVFIGIARSDTRETLAYCADKLLGLRIFSDEQGKMNRNVSDAGGAILAVSQFTLYGDCRRGRRPSFDQAAPPAAALELYNYFVDLLRKGPVPVETGEFQADMHVSLVNDGPVTIWIDSEDRSRQ